MPTYVVSKSITNTMLFIDYLSKKGNVVVDTFSTDGSSIVLNIRELDDNTISLLDTLVSTYQDRSSLSLEDVLSFRYARFHKSMDQPLPTALNTVTPVTFLSANVIDSNYYEISSDGAYVIIKKPGLYVFMAKVSAYLTGASVKTSSLNWFFQFDTTRSGTLFTNIANCSSYTYHVQPGNMYDSSTVICTYNVTSATGGYVRLACKQVTGGANLSVLNDCTSFQIMAASGLSMYDGTMTTAKTLTTTYMDVPLNSDRLIFNPLTHTVGQPTVKVNRAGTVYVVCKATFNKTSGTNASIGITSILLNGSNPNNNKYAYASALYSGGDKATIVDDCSLDVASGDVISFQAAINTGSNLNLSASESGLFVFYLTSVNNENNLFTGDISIGSAPITTMLATNSGFTDIQFQTQSESFPNYYLGLTFSPVTPQLTVNTTGMYIITANICFHNPNGVPRTVAVGIAESVDNGTTYIYQPGTTSVKRLSDVAGSYATVDAQHLVFLVRSNRIKLQVYSLDATASDNIQVANYTNLTAQCLQSTDNVVSVDHSLFGQNAVFVKSYDALSVSSTSWIEKCRVVTNYVLTGTYRIFLTAKFVFPNSTDTYNLQLVDFCSGGPTMMTRNLSTYSIDRTMTSYSLLQHSFLLEGIHNIVLGFSSPQGSILTVSDVVVEFWRYS